MADKEKRSRFPAPGPINSRCHTHSLVGIAARRGAMAPPPLVAAALLLLLVLFVLLVLLLLVELVLERIPANRTNKRGSHRGETATSRRVGSIAGRAGPHHRAHQPAVVLLPVLARGASCSSVLAVGGSTAAAAVGAALLRVAVLLLLLVALLRGVLVLRGWVLLGPAVALVLLLLLVRGGASAVAAAVLAVALLGRWIVSASAPALVVGGVRRGVALEVRECQPRSCDVCGACIWKNGRGDVAYLLGAVALLSVALATVLVLLVAATAARVVIVSRHDALLLLFAKEVDKVMYFVM